MANPPAAPGQLNRNLAIELGATANDAEFGEVHNRATQQPTKNAAMAPGAILSQRGTTYDDVASRRHVQLVSRAQDATGQGVWTVNEITYSTSNGVTTATVGSQSTITEAELNGRWIASSF